MKEYQLRVDRWIKQYGVRYFSETTNMMLLAEEVGELSRLIARKFGEQSFKVTLPDKEINQSIADELADILFVVSCMANQMGIDMNEAIERNFNKKTERDALRHKQNKKL